ncbi:hypothetical protein KA107_02535 [Candidatus Pacearchaeota archaeon]|nr:hypothetical protein [Candidatus Pacearchaeota archaeon]
MVMIRKDKAETILAQLKNNFPKVKLHFSGSTPPEIFVGRINYPNVFSGILSPTFKGDTSEMSSPEQWVEKNLSIAEVLNFRGQMIYGRQVTNIKASKSLQNVTQELALSSRSVSTEFFLKKQPQLQYTSSNILSIMANPAPIERVILEENPFVEKKVDYIVGDYDVKANTALQELYKAKISVSHLQKLFSVGLLGVKTNRKLVPTKWSITAIDDSISKKLLEKIKLYKEIEEIQIFSDEYNGNHYEIILLPGEFNFEVIEINVNDQNGVWRDYEGFFGRKNYASSVTGAYYANRLAICEYLEKFKRQATVLILRQVSEDYYAPLGVGILRELMRRALQKEYQKANLIKEALAFCSTRLRIPIEKYTEISWIVANYGKQKKLFEF